MQVRVAGTEYTHKASFCGETAQDGKHFALGPSCEQATDDRSRVLIVDTPSSARLVDAWC